MLIVTLIIVIYKSMKKYGENKK